MRSFLKWLIVTGLIVFLIGVYSFFLDFEASKISPVSEVGPVFVDTEALITPISTATIETEAPTQSSVIIPTATPDLTTVRGFWLDEKIDLSSGKSTAMVIQLPQGGNLASTWADAIAYQFGDDELAIDPFDPNAGTIYTILGDTAIVVAHSGQRNHNWDFFASGIDRYLRAYDESSLSTNDSIILADGVTRLEGFFGSTAYLCQSEEKVEPFTPFEKCPGSVVKLKLVTGVVVPEELVGEYGDNFNNLRSWLMVKFPEAGFDRITSDRGFLFVTCLQKYADQPSVEGVHGYEYNRVVLGFEVIK